MARPFCPPKANYLVTESVLDQVLTQELHCHGEPDVRAAVVAVFTQRYGEFLARTRQINFRLFLARRCGIQQVGPLPPRLNPIANVSLADVQAGTMTLEQAVPLRAEPSLEDEERFLAEFDGLDPRLHYRGHFALYFFLRFLDLLVADRNSEASVHFGTLHGDGFVAKGPFSLDSLAHKAPLPAGLQAFVSQIVH
jgi:hypothetical protein